MGCRSPAIDYIVDDPNGSPLLRDVIEILDALGELIAYEPAVTAESTPVYIEQEPLVA